MTYHNIKAHSTGSVLPYTGELHPTHCLHRPNTTGGPLDHLVSGGLKTHQMAAFWSQKGTQHPQDMFYAEVQV